MPSIVNVHQAKTHLSKLLKRAHEGEEIILAKAGKPYARLVPLEEASPRVPGIANGRIDDAFFDAFCTQVDDVLCRATSGDTNLGYIVVTTRHFEPSDRSADECRALKDAWYARNICITESAGGSSALRNIKISFGGEEYSEQSDLPTCKFVRVQQFRVYFPDPR